MRKKLIEVAPFLPLDAISVASKADKDKKVGTIKNVHKWFAPMPTPALRALIFATVVDAPDDEEERRRLLDLIERLVPPDGNPPSEEVLAEARAEIERSTGGDLPTIFDPFCGGGSTLVEAQRLGLPAMGSDLNPVPVLITRTLTELIPQCAGLPPVAGDTGKLAKTGGPLDGLIADVQHYAEIVRQQVWDKVGHLYPKGPNGETIIAWLWARTVECPNPACRTQMPLISNLWLSKRRGDHRWISLHPTNGHVEIKIERGPQGNPEQIKLPGNRPRFRCARCREGIADETYLRSEGQAGRMGVMPLAMATVAGKVRDYQLFSESNVPTVDVDSSIAEVEITPYARWFSPPGYGLTTYGDLFASRQLAMLEQFAVEIERLTGKLELDGCTSSQARAILSVLGLSVGKLAQSNSAQVRWRLRAVNSKAEPSFGRHDVPMVWDFAEANPFGGSVGDWSAQVSSICSAAASLSGQAVPAKVLRSDARLASGMLSGKAVIVTDPPYFDQIGYADLSDYFYIWHRAALKKVHPDLYGTIATPKESELIATPYRHGGKKEAAAKYFIEGFTEAFKSLQSAASPDHPIVIVYAHRQEESSSLGSASTGWDAMLEAVLAAGLKLVGTLPVRGTGSSRQIGQGTNSLASYIVMVCRPRGDSSSPGSIAQFRSTLRKRLPGAVNALLATGESMVDIRQAAIGPGMEVFSQYSEVFDGIEPIPVRRALSIINEELGRLLDDQLGEVDDETRWACQWYSDRGFAEGDFDDALKLAAVYGLGVDGLAEAGVIAGGRGRVRLVPRSDLRTDWMGDDRIPVWEATQHLALRLTKGNGGGEREAATLLAALGEKASGVRELAQYLTNLAIEKGWSDDAIAFDSLVKSWPRIEQLSVEAAPDSGSGQLFKV